MEGGADWEMQSLGWEGSELGGFVVILEAVEAQEMIFRATDRGFRNQHETHHGRGKSEPSGIAKATCAKDEQGQRPSGEKDEPEIQ